MHAAGILSDIAADGASDLARRVRSVVEAPAIPEWVISEIGHAGLRNHAAIVDIDIEDLLNFPMPSRTPSGSGRAPPESEVPAPRGTILTLFAAQ